MRVNVDHGYHERRVLTNETPRLAAAVAQIDVTEIERTMRDGSSMRVGPYVITRVDRPGIYERTRLVWRRLRAEMGM